MWPRSPRETPEQLANRLQREGKVEEIESALAGYPVEKLRGKELESYHHLWGITAFRRGDRAEAFKRFAAGLALFPDSPPLLFSLGQEHEARRDIANMLACFDRCRFPQLAAPFVLAMARYAYLWNRPDKAAAYLEPITEAYFELGIADDHFVYVRGLPFFSQTWGYVIACARLQNDFAPTDDLIARAKKRLVDYDFARLAEFYACVKTGDYTPEVARLEREMSGRNPQFPSTGYLRCQHAVLRAVAAPATAEEHLATVTFGANDFRWLPDIVLVARARARWALGDVARESALRETFLHRQPLLFEPDHAVNFAFLDYQESLKPRYQQPAA